MPVDAGAATDTFLSMSSDTGDYIGQGKNYFYTGTDGLFTAEKNYDNGVSISFNTPTYSHWWDLDFAAAQSALLTPGTYAGATRFPFQAATEPGLAVGGDGRGCNTLTGSFVVRLIVYGAGTTIDAFWATFEQHCEGATPALRGEIRYNVPNPDLGFYTLTPCRVFDTRVASGPTLGAPLTCGTAQSFTVAGKCGVPTSAKAVSLNLTGTGSIAQGNLRLFASGTPAPLVSNLNYTAGQTRANNAVAPLGDGGQISVLCSPSGSTHVVLDVNGYFQ